MPSPVGAHNSYLIVDQSCSPRAFIIGTRNSSNDYVHAVNDSPEDKIDRDMTHVSKILIDAHCHLDFLQT